MGMGGSGPRNDGVRLPDYSLVPTIIVRGSAVNAALGFAALLPKPGLGTSQYHVATQYFAHFGSEADVIRIYERAS